ncbi:ribosome silencing factor [Flavobacteriaceae bacterium Ap0902]|nr:ribosome silencing factor [Flavobacteriaceae bacterium Ap0902]
MSKKESNKLIDTIVDAIDDVKGEDITLLDLTEIDNSVAQYFIICSAKTNTQVNAISSNIEKKVRNQIQERPIHVEGKENAQWVLIDYGNVVVHIFQPIYREYYDIESMWGDAKLVTY